MLNAYGWMSSVKSKLDPTARLRSVGFLPRHEPLEDRRMLASVAGRYVFYNDSAYDGWDVAATAADDAAIATDKVALSPGQTATFANYSSYHRGLNGLIVDVMDLAEAKAIGIDDLSFRVGNTNDFSNWADAPSPTEINVREGAGVDGADRVTVTWADNAIQNQWLEITIGATPQTGLEQPDVFIFGNAIGESGNDVFRAAVNEQDERGPRDNPHAFFNLAEIDDRFDYNRDRYVNATDQIIARNNLTNSASELRMLGQTDAPIRIVYDPITGSLTVVSDDALTTVEVISGSGAFSGETPSGFNGLFDVYNPEKAFRLDPAGFTSVDLGQVPPGLSLDFLLNDLIINGSLIAGGSIGHFEILIQPSFQGVLLIYDAATGNLSLTSDFELSTFHVISDRGVFTADPAEGFLGPEDVDDDNNLYKEAPEGIYEFDIGTVMPRGLTQDFLLGDLSITGTNLDGSDITSANVSTINERRGVAAEYDANSGTITIDGPLLEAVEIRSQNGILTGVADPRLDEPEEVDTDEQIILRDDTGFQTIAFPHVGQVGWDSDFLGQDLIVSGTIFGGNRRDSSGLRVIAPTSETKLVYSIHTGNVALETGFALSEFDMKSEGGIFSGVAAMDLGGASDVDEDGRIFKESSIPFGDLDFGAIAVTGLSRSELRNDLEFAGKLSNGASLGNVRLSLQPARTAIIYDATSGDVSLETNEDLSSLSLMSASGILRGSCSSIDVVFVCNPREMTGAVPVGMDDGLLRHAVPRWLESDLVADLSVEGTLRGGGEPTFELVVIPEMDPTFVTYDAASGAVSVNTPFQLGSFEVTSASGRLTKDAAQNVAGVNDLDTDSIIRKLDPAGFQSLTFGNVMETGLLETFLTSDISFSGTLVNGDPLSNIQLIVTPQQNVVQVIYDANNGNVSLSANAPLQGIDVRSAVSFFGGTALVNLDGPDDLPGNSRLLKLDPTGFRSVDFGQIARTGWTDDVVGITIDATLLGGETVVAEFIHIPEIEQNTVVYDANTGELSLETSLQLTTLEIVSKTGIFTGDPALNLGDQFDVDRDDKLFKLAPFGIGGVTFGNVAQTGLPGVFVEQDLAILGSRLGGGPLGEFILRTVPTGTTAATVYNAETGEFWVQSDRPLASFSVTSSLGIFTGEPSKNLGGMNDVDTDFTIAKQDAAGFANVDLGAIAGIGFQESYLVGDLQFEATLQDGSPLERVDFYVIPATPEAKAVFDASTGELSFSSNSPLESIDVVSTSGIFTAETAEQLGGPSDIDSDTRIFKLDPGGIRNVSFGTVAQVGLADTFVSGDLMVVGTFLGESEARPIELEVIPDFGDTSVTFDSRAGTIRLQTNLVLNRFEIVSGRGIFTGRDSTVLDGPEDLDTDTHLVKNSEEGFSSLFLYEVAAPGLTESFLAGDLTITGERLGGGGIGNVELNVPSFLSHATVTITSETGSIQVSSNAALETFEIQSESGILTGEAALELGGPDDVDTDTVIVKQSDSGFQSVELGPVLQSGWSDTVLNTDLTFSGTLLGGTSIDSIDKVIRSDSRNAILTYNWQTGTINIASDVELSRVEIISESGILSEQPAINLGGPNDVDTDTLILKEDSNGITFVEFGMVAQPGLTRQDIFDDLTFRGQRTNGVPLLNYELAVEPLQIGLIYQVDTGALTLESDELITTLEITSRDGLFTGSRPPALSGFFDFFQPGKLFKLEPAGFSNADFGPILPPNLTRSILTNDFSFDGSLADGGAIGEIPIIIGGHRAPTITYDAATGEISVDVEDSLISLSITSDAGIFTADPAENLGGPLDVDSDTQLIKHDDVGIHDLTLGTVATTGLTEPFLIGDLTIRGIYSDNSPFSGGNLQVIPQVNDVGVTYDAATGQISVHSNAPLESVLIESGKALFLSNEGENLNGPDDELSSSLLMKVDPFGFREIAFGSVAQTGWLEVDLLSSVTATATLLGGIQIDNIPLLVIPETTATRFVYDANTGQFSWDSPIVLTTLEITSERGIFTGDPAQNLEGQFDVDNDRKLFKLRTDGFTSFNFGNVVETGLPDFLLRHDLSIRGTRPRGGPVGRIEFETIPFADQTSVVYDATSGEIAVESDVLLTTFQMTSERGILTGDDAADLISPNDVDSDSRILKENLFGFSSTYFGQVAEDGLTEAFMTQDLSFDLTTKGDAATNLDFFVIPHQPNATLVYHEPTGELWLETNSPLESIDIVSTTGILNADPAQNLGAGGVDSDTRISKQDLAGFRDLRIGTVIQPGMEAEVLADLSVTVTLLGGEVFSDVSLRSIPDLGETTVRYDASDGTIRVRTNLQLDSLTLESARGIFVGLPATDLDGAEDVDTDTQLVKVDPDGFRSVTLSSVAAAGLTEAFVTGDLTVHGTRIGGGGLGELTFDVKSIQRIIGITYDAASGSISVDSNMFLESIDISSAGGILSGADSAILNGPDDVDTDNRIAKVDPSGFHHLEFASVTQQGWDSEFIASDLTVSGTLFGGTPAGTIIVVVRPDQRATRVVYNRLTGGLWVDTDVELKSISIASAGGIFTAEPAQSVSGANDVDTDLLILKHDNAGFTDVQFGAVAQTGYSLPFIVSDFTVTGTRVSDAPLQNIDIVVQPSSTSLIYNSSTGEVYLEADPLLTTLEIKSASNIITGQCPFLDGLFDVCSPFKYFKLSPGGFGNVSLGPILPPGLEQEFLTQDLTIDGSLIDGGPLQLTNVVVVEPPAAVIVQLAAIGRHDVDRNESLITKKRQARPRFAADVLAIEHEGWLPEEEAIRIISDDLNHHHFVA